MTEQKRRAQHFQGGSGYTQLRERAQADVAELIEYFICRSEQEFLFDSEKLELLFRTFLFGHYASPFFLVLFGNYTTAIDAIQSTASCLDPDLRILALACTRALSMCFS